MPFPFHKQSDSMQCGATCLRMVLEFYGHEYSNSFIGDICRATAEGVSMLGISESAKILGLEVVCGYLSIEALTHNQLPCILHWNQNHFVVLYKIREGNLFYIADPGKGLVRYSLEEFTKCWINVKKEGEEKGIAMLLEPGPEFEKIYSGYRKEHNERKTAFRFLYGYLRQYRKYFTLIILGLALGCLLQLIMPFLTQAIVDIGIRHSDIGLIWLILLGELMIIIGRTATDFIRRWLLLHISMRINISLVSDFFIKLLRRPMSFFDTKLMGDLLQRIGDHSRVQNFLTGQLLNVVFTFLSFVIFGIVLFIYNPLIFAIFVIGSIVYGLWIVSFLRKRKVLDYELFEQQAKNQNRTYQFITSMQEIKLQNCEQRRRWEWEDTQTDLFNVQMKSLKLQQTQEAGSIFINEVKNIIITVLAATAVINGQMSLGAMLAVQYIIGQLN